MFAHKGAQECRRIPLATIDKVVSARLGADALAGECATRGFQSSDRHVPGQACGRVEHDTDRQILQRPRSFDSLLRTQARGGASRK